MTATLPAPSDVRVPTARRNDVQGLRALAVILVVVYHTDVALPGGFIGVDVFFVISGFVITRMLRSELHSRDGIDFRRFYLRRIRRILPPLAVMLAFVVMLSVFLGPIGARVDTARTGIAAALVNANTYLIRSFAGGYFDQAAEGNALLHTWSLSVEEQFYLVFPALLGLAWWFRRRRPSIAPDRALTIALFVIAGGSFAISWYLSRPGQGTIITGDPADLVGFYSSVSRAWEFAAGGILAVLASRLAPTGRRWATLAAVLGLLMVAWAALAFNEFTAFPGTAALLPVVGTVLIIAAGEKQPQNRITSVLSLASAQRLGDLSYSWYLWHWPAIVFAVALWPGSTVVATAAALLSLIPAAASYKYVENPIRFAPRTVPRRTVGLAALCVVAPLLVGAVVLAGNQRLDGRASFASFESSFEKHVGETNGCGYGLRLADVPPDDCYWSVQESDGVVALVGDSNAAHFVAGFVDGSGRAGLDATTATKNSCPFVDLIIIRENIERDDCREFVTGSMDDLIDLAPDFVVLASSTDAYLESSSIELKDPLTGTTSVTSDDKAMMWIGGLRRTVEALESAGIDVVIIHPVPKFPGWDPRACSTARWLSDETSCGRTLSRDAVERLRAPALDVERQALADTSAVLVDLYDSLCLPTECRTSVDGEWRWRDSDHISSGMSMSLSGEFYELAVSATDDAGAG